MNLMTFVRLLALLVIGWTVLALGAGVLGIGTPDSAGSTYFLPRPSLHDALPLHPPEAPGDAEYRLLDQTNGQTNALALPAREDWSLLSVSPWRDKDGNLEVAGRWVCAREGGEGFCGIGFMTLPDSTVKRRVTLDVLPSGKPCWVYGRPGEVLFPAADGKLYRCNIAGQAGEKRPDDSRRLPLNNDENVLQARAVAWATKMPGLGAAALCDPAWSSEPLLGHLVFVSLSHKVFRDGCRVILPAKLWWLVMNDEGDTIVNAGRLTVPGPEEPTNDTIFERLPSIKVGAGGEISLAYLTRESGQRFWQLQSAKLEIDAETAVPRMLQSGTRSNALANDLAPSPLVFSANGECVFAMDGTGQIVKYSIPR
jgi:hypothetical protein